MSVESFPAASAAPARANTTVFHRFLRRRMAAVGLALVVLLVLACALGPFLLRHDPLTINMRGRFLLPFSDGHVLGTDEMGRDLLARILDAGRYSLLIGILAMSISVFVGGFVGIVAGFYRGILGHGLMRFVDGMLCFPSIFLLLTLAALTSPGVVTTTIIIGLTAWMSVARLVHSSVQELCQREFIAAARALGLRDWRIMIGELLPNVAAPLCVAATLIVARAILLESYVSYLGYGIQPPVASWGNMLQKAQQYFNSAPWLAILPGLMITIAVAGFNAIGDGLRDALNPRGRPG
ncbi:ABC transporter permease [Pseudochelatococcus contaminans]|uniref:Peptide/nickel transport system permease protein n=1 Tax=Pseudochelatococcus contaminans TaxID=1538103 RepID=A0A7W6EI24_9HYPH|nr:ABC transporter permease [Pseudochelatococcus contaminans]MBB3810277.1 peptide/nickel transport system permease protein [Pseudochelatococcus contaminans]